MESTVANTPRMDFYSNKAFLTGLSVCCGEKVFWVVCNPENMWSSTTWGIIWAKTLMLGKTEGRRRRDDRGWDGWRHHPLDAHVLEQALGVGDEQGGLACCSPWGCRESNTTEQLNWTELIWANVVARVWDSGELGGWGGILCPLYNLKSKTPIPGK